MKLYYHPLSTYCQKVLIAFYEKSVDFTSEIVSLSDETERDTYRKVYPLGKIPLLWLGDDHRIPESTIIIEYLDSHFGGRPKLVPDDPESSLQVRCNDRMLDLYLNESVTTLVIQSRKAKEKRNPKLIDRSRFRVDVMYDLMEANLETRTWSSGEQFTLSDCAAVPPLVYSEEVAPLDQHPNLAAYWQRLQERPSVRRVLDEAAPYLAKTAKR